jgi:hypothetical protein
MRHTRSLRILAPVRRVWALIDDDTRLALWMPNVIATRYPDGKPKKGKRVGIRFTREMSEGGNTSSYAGEITEYEPGRLLGVLLRPEAMAIHVVYHVDGDEDWTRLDYGCDVRPASLKGWLMVILGRRMLTSILDQQLARLKLVAETRRSDI